MMIHVMCGFFKLQMRFQNTDDPEMRDDETKDVAAQTDWRMTSPIDRSAQRPFTLHSFRRI